LIRKKCWSSPYAIPESNPNPENFRIVEETFENGFLVLLVEYPDCKNFEGKKLMVYNKFRTSAELLKANGGKLDPHFASSGTGPIARFEPTELGLKMAATLVRAG
jgi:hypothetical protein